MQPKLGGTVVLGAEASWLSRAIGLQLTLLSKVEHRLYGWMTVGVNALYP
jgi:hypothetical protein